MDKSGLVQKTPRDGEGQRSLACYSPWGHKESDTIEQLCSYNSPYKGKRKERKKKIKSESDQTFRSANL